MSFAKTPEKKELVPFQKESIASNQQLVPLPFVRGTRLVAVRWMSPARDQISFPAKGAGKKG